MPVKALLALTVVAAVLIGLTLPGPSMGHKPEQRSSLQTLVLHSS